MQVQPQFTFDRVAFDRSTDAHLVLSLVAPALTNEAPRPSLCIVPAIDVSGSMQGEKLAFAKASALRLLDHLRAEDYAGLVVFADVGEVVYSPARMSPENKEALRAKIQGITVQGSTNLADGLCKALEVVKRLDLPSTVLSRVLLLTDGQPNMGLAKTAEALRALVATNRGPATVSAFGYGSDADQELLSQLAGEGQGNYAFVQHPDHALAAFGKELGGLLSTYAQNLIVEIQPHNGHQIVEVLSSYKVHKEVDGEVVIWVPGLLAEETNPLVLSIKFAPQKAAGPRLVNTFDIRVSYDILAVDGRVERRTVEAKAKAQFVREGEAQTTPNQDADAIAARVQLLKVQAKAEEAAKHGDFKASQEVFRHFQVDLASRGLDALAGMAAHVGSRYTSSMYASSEGSRVGLRAALTRGVGVSSLASDDQSLLESVGYVTSNATQESFSAEFRAPVATPAPPPAPVSVGSPPESRSLGRSWLVGASPLGMSHDGSHAVNMTSMRVDPTDQLSAEDLLAQLNAVNPPKTSSAAQKPPKKEFSKKRKGG